MNREELIEKSDVIKPRNLKSRNNVLGDWIDVFGQEIKERRTEKP